VRGSRPAEGRTFIAEVHDLAASLSYFRQGKLTFGEWWRSLQGLRELAWLSPDDPLPCVMMCIRLLFGVGRRLLGRKPASHGGSGAPRYVMRRRESIARRA